MYVANGEIGVVGQYKGKKAAYRRLPWKLEVEFSSQPGLSYGFGGDDFGREGDSRLELAYAITVHKAQGSEFGLTFLVFPANAMLSRELRYQLFSHTDERNIYSPAGFAMHSKLASVLKNGPSARARRPQRG